MHSILTVTTAAKSYDLTTLANVKAELGISTGVSDSVLGRYITSASKAASQYCNRVFAAEAVSEQFLPNRAHLPVRGGVKPLQLARYPLVSVATVTEESVALALNTDYLVDPENGQLTRINDSGREVLWHPLPLAVSYTAGYETIPPDVEDAIIRMVTRRFAAKGRDPNLKQQNIPGVLEQSWWIATGTETGNMSPDITDVLDNYRTPLTA